MRNIVSPLSGVISPFTLAAALGPDLVSNGDFDFGPEIVANGDFSLGDQDWTKGDGWSIGSGLASCDGTQAIPSDLISTAAAAAVVGATYQGIFTLSNRAAGGARLNTGGTDSIFHNLNGTYTENIIAVDTSLPRIRANEFLVGDVDNVSFKEVPAVLQWTIGAGWSFSDGFVECDGSQGANTSISQDVGLQVVSVYKITFEILTLTAGLITSVSLGGTTDGTDHNSTGIKTVTITTTNITGDLTITGDTDFAGTISNVTVERINP